MGAMRWQREERSRRDARREQLQDEINYRGTAREIEDIDSQIRRLQRALNEKQADLERQQGEARESEFHEEARRGALGDIRGRRSSGGPGKEGGKR